MHDMEFLTKQEMFAIPYAQVQEQWPEALVLLDHQCQHLAEASDLWFRTVKKNGRLVAEAPSAGTAHWHPEVGVWVRWRAGVSSRPRREAEIMVDVTQGRRHGCIIDTGVEVTWSDHGRPPVVYKTRLEADAWQWRHTNVFWVQLDDGNLVPCRAAHSMHGV